MSMRRSASSISTSGAGVDQRPDVDLGEAGVAARGGVEGGDPDQAVDAALGGEEAVGVLAAGDEGGRLQPRLLPRRGLLHLDLEAAPFGPAQVHPQEDLGPVLGVGPAGAGVDGDDGVAGVVLAAEQARLLELFQARSRPRPAGRRARPPSPRPRPPSRPGRRGRRRRTRARETVFSRFCARACAAEVVAAVSWSSQKPGCPISASSRSASASSAAGSKVVREQGQLLADGGQARCDRFGGRGVGHDLQLRTCRRGGPRPDPRMAASCGCGGRAARTATPSRPRRPRDRPRPSASSRVISATAPRSGLLVELVEDDRLLHAAGLARRPHPRRLDALAQAPRSQ